jgi:benzoylformate decarboxylase
MLAGHDLVLVAGSSVFPYYPNIPGPLLPDGTALVAITSDPDEAARAPMGDAIVADPALTLQALVAAIGDAPDGRAEVEPRPAPDEVELTEPMNASTAMRALRAALPDDGIVVLEAPSSTLALRNQLRLSRPGSYYFGAGGGLGFGLPASVGVQMAEPDRPVVCVVGEGSAQYAIQTFWTAAAYQVPVTFLVVRNDEYAILKWFAAIEQVEGAPGLDLPRLDCVAVASGYGVESRRADDPDALRTALEEGIGARRPNLVEVRVAPGMALA